MTEPIFQFRISVVGDTPEEEEFAVRQIASEFIRRGVPVVAVIADGQPVTYVDGEVRPATFSEIFQTHPTSPVGAHVRTN